MLISPSLFFHAVRSFFGLLLSSCGSENPPSLLWQNNVVEKCTVSCMTPESSHEPRPGSLSSCTAGATCVHIRQQHWQPQGSTNSTSSMSSTSSSMGQQTMRGHSRTMRMCMNSRSWGSARVCSDPPSPFFHAVRLLLLVVAERNMTGNIYSPCPA